MQIFLPKSPCGSGLGGAHLPEAMASSLDLLMACSMLHSMREEKKPIHNKQRESGGDPSYPDVQVAVLAGIVSGGHSFGIQSRNLRSLVFEKQLSAGDLVMHSGQHDGRSRMQERASNRRDRP